MYLVNSNSPFFPTPSPRQPPSPSVSGSMTILDVSYKCNKAVFMHSQLIYVVPYGRMFFLRADNIPSLGSLTFDFFISKSGIIVLLLDHCKY